MVFHWSLSVSKSPQVFRTLLSILADLSNAVVWMASTCPLISMSSSPFTNPINIGITVTFIFHSFFSSIARFTFSSLFSPSFNFTLWSAGTTKSTIRQVFLYLLTITKFGRLAEIRWSVCASKSQKSSSGRILGCAYTTSSFGKI